MLKEVQYQTEGTKFLKRFVDGHPISPLLLIGPAGVGKKFSVIKAIQEAFCMGTRESDCPCSSCYTISKDIHPDFLSLKADNKDIGIAEIRWLIDEAKNYPSVAKIRCFIIDGVDHFTVPAANAFLKILEEPPNFLRFFLLAETEDRVLPTIRSRCGRVGYAPLPEAFVLSIVQRYEESTKALVYTRMGEGSVGNALHYWGSGKLDLRDQALKLFRLTVEKDLPSLFSSVDDMDQDFLAALKFMEQILHDIIILRVNPAKIIHVDCLEELKFLGRKAPLQVWAELSRKIERLSGQCRTVRLNTSFHLKTVLVEAF